MRVLLALILVGLLAAGQRTRAAAIQAMLAWPLANELSDVFKNLVGAARPSVELEGVRFISDFSGRLSFLDSPGTMSAHSANMAAVAMVLSLRLGWWGASWWVLAFLTGLSRIYVGVHYPSQVILGWLGGGICAWVVVKTWDAAVAIRKSNRESTVGPQGQ